MHCSNKNYATGTNVELLIVMTVTQISRFIGMIFQFNVVVLLIYKPNTKNH